MTYKNGKDILPPGLLKELQKYIEGELVYIPKGSATRAGWGENNGTRQQMQSRNREIYIRYKNGASTLELTKLYHLSEDSIRKIVMKMRQAQQEAVTAR